MNRNKYNITEIRYPDSIYKLGVPTEIMDEGSFYKIDDTHIFDKYKIVSIKNEGNQIIVHMKEQDVVLTVIERK